MEYWKNRKCFAPNVTKAWEEFLGTKRKGGSVAELPTKVCSSNVDSKEKTAAGAVQKETLKKRTRTLETAKNSLSSKAAAAAKLAADVSVTRSRKSSLIAVQNVSSSAPVLSDKKVPESPDIPKDVDLAAAMGLQVRESFTASSAELSAPPVVSIRVTAPRRERTTSADSIRQDLLDSSVPAPKSSSMDVDADDDPPESILIVDDVHLTENIDVFSVCNFIARLSRNFNAPLRIESVAFHLFHLLCRKIVILFRDIPAVATACFVLSNKICVDDCIMLRLRFILKKAQALIHACPLFYAAAQDTSNKSAIIPDEFFRKIEQENADKAAAEAQKEAEKVFLKELVNVKGESKKITGSGTGLGTNNGASQEGDTSQKGSASQKAGQEVKEYTQFQREVLQMERRILIMTNFNLSFNPPSVEDGALLTILEHVTVPDSVRRDAIAIFSMNFYKFSYMVFQDSGEVANTKKDRTFRWLRTLSCAALVIAAEKHNKRCRQRATEERLLQEENASKLDTEEGEIEGETDSGMGAVMASSSNRAHSNGNGDLSHLSVSNIPMTHTDSVSHRERGREREWGRSDVTSSESMEEVDMSRWGHKLRLEMDKVRDAVKSLEYIERVSLPRMKGVFDGMVKYYEEEGRLTGWQCTKAVSPSPSSPTPYNATSYKSTYPNSSSSRKSSLHRREGDRERERERDQPSSPSYAAQRHAPHNNNNNSIRRGPGSNNNNSAPYSASRPSQEPYTAYSPFPVPPSPITIHDDVDMDVEVAPVVEDRGSAVVHYYETAPIKMMHSDIPPLPAEWCRPPLPIAPPPPPMQLAPPPPSAHPISHPKFVRPPPPPPDPPKMVKKPGLWRRDDELRRGDQAALLLCVKHRESSRWTNNFPSVPSMDNNGAAACTTIATAEDKSLPTGEEVDRLGLAAPGRREGLGIGQGQGGKEGHSTQYAAVQSDTVGINYNARVNSSQDSISATELSDPVTSIGHSGSSTSSSSSSSKSEDGSSSTQLVNEALDDKSSRPLPRDAAGSVISPNNTAIAATGSTDAILPGVEGKGKFALGSSAIVPKEITVKKSKVTTILDNCTSSPPPPPPFPPSVSVTKALFLDYRDVINHFQGRDIAKLPTSIATSISTSTSSGMLSHSNQSNISSRNSSYANSHSLGNGNSNGSRDQRDRDTDRGLAHSASSSNRQQQQHRDDHHVSSFPSSSRHANDMGRRQHSGDNSDRGRSGDRSWHGDATHSNTDSHINGHSNGTVGRINGYGQSQRHSSSSSSSRGRSSSYDNEGKGKVKGTRGGDSDTDGIYGPGAGPAMDMRGGSSSTGELGRDRERDGERSACAGVDYGRLNGDISSNRSRSRDGWNTNTSNKTKYVSGRTGQGDTFNSGERRDFTVRDSIPHYRSGDSTTNIGNRPVHARQCVDNSRNSHDNYNKSKDDNYDNYKDRNRNSDNGSHHSANISSHEGRGNGHNNMEGNYRNSNISSSNHNKISEDNKSSDNFSKNNGNSIRYQDSSSSVNNADSRHGAKDDSDAAFQSYLDSKSTNEKSRGSGRGRSQENHGNDDSSVSGLHKEDGSDRSGSIIISSSSSSYSGTDKYLDLIEEASTGTVTRTRGLITLDGDNGNDDDTHTDKDIDIGVTREEVVTVTDCDKMENNKIPRKVVMSLGKGGMKGQGEGGVKGLMSKPDRIALVHADGELKEIERVKREKKERDDRERAALRGFPYNPTGSGSGSSGMTSQPVPPAVSVIDRAKQVAAPSAPQSVSVPLISTGYRATSEVRALAVVARGGGKEGRDPDVEEGEEEEKVVEESAPKPPLPLSQPPPPPPVGDGCSLPPHVTDLKEMLTAIPIESIIATPTRTTRKGSHLSPSHVSASSRSDTSAVIQLSSPMTTSAAAVAVSSVRKGQSPLVPSTPSTAASPKGRMHNSPDRSTRSRSSSLLPSTPSPRPLPPPPPLAAPVPEVKGFISRYSKSDSGVILPLSPSPSLQALTASKTTTAATAISVKPASTPTPIAAPLPVQKVEPSPPPASEAVGKTEKIAMQQKKRALSNSASISRQNEQVDSESDSEPIKIFKKQKSSSEFPLAIRAMNNLRSAKRTVVPASTTLKSVIAPIAGTGGSNFVTLSVSSTATAVGGDSSYVQLSEPRNGLGVVSHGRNKHSGDHSNGNGRGHGSNSNFNNNGNGRGSMEHPKDKHGGHTARDSSRGSDRGGSNKRHRDDMPERDHSRKRWK